ncbi:hypothetical protein O1611_g2528 [Lasiodiplodia mahajangana]|uniref:Uncharacterized protein n=1 Tax=Lasiodiplodia mahajangana TaxID=1108764 RepID=A0ACC2JUU1_9PEZI|nr:hypothetical protein O1611_g2528 [Lasiodiplodia mahajangana]
MDQCRPLNRISIASLEDDQFFRAHSTQPPSRLMSTFASRRDGSLPEDVPTAAQPSERSLRLFLTQATLPSVDGQTSFDRAETHEVPSALDAISPSEGTSTTSSDAVKDSLVSLPEPSVTTRRWSSATGREQGLTACHYQSRLPLTTEPQLDYYIGKHETDSILSNVRTYLSTRQRVKNPRKPTLIVTNENNTLVTSIQAPADNPLPASPENQYLVTTDNIARILDIVVAGVRGIQADGVQPDCQSLLFFNAGHAKPTLRNQNIIPGVSAAAEPATTICSPQPCFSAADGFEKSGRSYSTPKTTYSMPQRNLDFRPSFFRTLLSPNTPKSSMGSFSDSSCQDDAYHDDVYLDCLNASVAGAEVSEPSGSVTLLDSYQGRHHSWPQSCRIARRVSFWPSPPQTSFNPFEEQFRQARKRSISEPLPQIQLRDEGIHVATPAPMASFPRLVSRSCTNDWLTPLGLFDDVENNEQSEFRTMISSLYSHGIDAHSGVPVCNPLPTLEEGSQTASTSPIHSPLEVCHPRLQTQENQGPPQGDQLHEGDGEKVGRSMGAASHRRIRVREPHNPHKDTTQNLVDGLRHYRFTPTSDQEPEYILSEQPPQPSWIRAALEGDGMQKRSSRDMLQRILRQSDPSSMRSSRSKSS